MCGSLKAKEAGLRQVVRLPNQQQEGLGLGV